MCIGYNATKWDRLLHKFISPRCCCRNATWQRTSHLFSCNCPIAEHRQQSHVVAATTLNVIGFKGFNVSPDDRLFHGFGFLSLRKGRLTSWSKSTEYMEWEAANAPQLGENVFNRVPVFHGYLSINGCQLFLYWLYQLSAILGRGWRHTQHIGNIINPWSMMTIPIHQHPDKTHH